MCQPGDLGSGPNDLERHVDRPVSRGVEVLAGSGRIEKSKVGKRVLLDQLLAAQSQLLGSIVRGRSLRPLPA